MKYILCFFILIQIKNTFFNVDQLEGCNAQFRNTKSFFLRAIDFSIYCRQFKNCLKEKNNYNVKCVINFVKKINNYCSELSLPKKLICNRLATKNKIILHSNLKNFKKSSPSLKSTSELKSRISNIVNYIKNKISKKTYITQEDFKEGSLIIIKPGKYIFKENIIFDPPSVPSNNLLRENKAFLLGFFAAIVIQSDNVTIDLNKFELKQSRKHYLNQRFYSHIELGSAPFVENFGPSNFTDDFIAVKNVVIENGVLGLSAHHGIHGNRCENVIVRNLNISEFELGGISINAGVNFRVKDVVVGPASRIVPVLGTFSSGKQILGYLESLSRGGFLCFDENADDKTPFIQIRDSIKTIDEILLNLNNVLKETEIQFLQNRTENIPKIFRNDSRLPNGGSMYGILFNVEGSAVGKFNNLENNTSSKDIHLRNIIIKGLFHKPIERVALQVDNETRTEDFLTAQIDSRGTSFDILGFTNSEGTYIPNPLGDAQLITSKYKKCLSEKKSEFRELHLYNTDTSRDSISPKILEWASSNDPEILNNKYVCNTDQMLHSIKGTIPLRFGGVNNVSVKNIKIENIVNFSPFGSIMCGDYKSKKSFKHTKPGYLAADIRGITIESCKNIRFRNTLLKNLKAKSGTVIGLDSMFKSDEISGRITTEYLSTINLDDLPDNFNEIPQSDPLVFPIMISPESSCTIKVKNI